MLAKANSSLASPRLQVHSLRAAGVLLCFRREGATGAWEPHTAVRHSNLVLAGGGKAGRGLFALRDFAVGATVGTYDGAVLGRLFRGICTCCSSDLYWYSTPTTIS